MTVPPCSKYFYWSKWLHSNLKTKKPEEYGAVYNFKTQAVHFCGAEPLPKELRSIVGKTVDYVWIGPSMGPFPADGEVWNHKLAHLILTEAETGQTMRIILGSVNLKVYKDKALKQMQSTMPEIGRAHV